MNAARKESFGRGLDSRIVPVSTCGQRQGWIGMTDQDREEAQKAAKRKWARKTRDALRENGLVPVTVWIPESGKAAHRRFVETLLHE